jgi:RNA polymerase-binding transcription factor DksA
LIEEIREELLSSEHERYSTAIDHHVHEAQDIEVALRSIDAGSFGMCINYAVRFKSNI